MRAMSRPKLPMLLALAGAGYYVFTDSQKPRPGDEPAMLRWHEHMEGAHFALAFGLGSGIVLWWLGRNPAFTDRISRA